MGLKYKCFPGGRGFGGDYLHIEHADNFGEICPRNYMQILICSLRPLSVSVWLVALSQTKNVTGIILGFGAEFTYTNRHIISGRHAQELYADFYMPP